MITWVLVFYMSTWAGNGSTGGPAVIDGFTSKEKCEAHVKKMKKLERFDYGVCMEAEK